MLLFLDVKYYLSPSLPQELQSKLSIALADDGATRVPLDEASHVITNSNQFEGWETVADTVLIVTVRVRLSLVLEDSFLSLGTMGYSVNIHWQDTAVRYIVVKIRNR
jgi:hypothetical protein